MGVTLATGRWDDGQAVCQAEFGAGYVFAVPTTAYQNSILKYVSLLGEAGIQAENIWLKYSKTTDGTWLVNGAPTVSLGTFSVDEGSSVLLSASASDPDDDELTYAWDLDGSDTFATAGATATFSAADLDGPATQQIKVRVTDSQGFSAVAEGTVNVQNVAPTLSAVAGSTIAENGTATVSGKITDPGTDDTFTLMVDWKDGGASQTYTYGAGTTTFSVQHQYLDDNPTGTASDTYAVDLGITDDDSGVGTASANVTVNNVAPTLTATGSTISENGTATVSGSITDPGKQDTFTLTIDWKDGGAPQTYPYPAGTTTFSVQHQYLDDNPTGTASDTYAVALSLRDDDGGAGTASANVTVNNVNPVARIDQLTDDAGVVLGASDVALQGLALAANESYSDVGTRDTRTAVRDWGDGKVESLGTVTAATSGIHVYAAAGTYTLKLTVTDDDTGVGLATRQIVVITPAGATTMAIANLRTATSTNPTAAAAIAAALVDLDGNNGGAANNGALDKLQSNDPNAALTLISKALQDLRAAEVADSTLNFSALKKQLTLTAKSVTVNAINRAAAVASSNGEKKQVADARTSVNQGQALLTSGDYVGAVAKFQDALQKALGVLAAHGL